MYFPETTNMFENILKSTPAIVLMMAFASFAFAADFDRDGKADYTVFRADSNTWFCETSGPADSTTVRWGNSTDVLVPADYDGDGQTDVATWRPSNGVWYIQQ